MGYANSVRLTGYVASAELRSTQGGQSVLDIRMATNESFFDKNANARKDRVEWHSVVVWGKVADGLSMVIDQGSLIGVQGRLQTRSWEDKNGGGKRYKTEIVAEEVKLLGGKRDGGGRGAGNSGDDHSDDADGGYGDSDIPF